jgi:carbamoyl-phosphate synthase large subunit
MKTKGKLLIFGAGMLQVSLIKTAKDIGYYTIVIDPDLNAVGKNVADEFDVVSGSDYETTFAIANNNKVKGIVTTATDKPLLMMAKVAEKLCLPFPSETAIYNTTNKFELKKILVNNKIPCAKGVLTNLTKLDDVLNTDITLPVIIKPIDSSGSRGVFYCKTIEEVKDAYPKCTAYSKYDKVLIEEYLDGPEISIEALVQDNNLHVIQITDKTVTPFPYTVEMGHLQPSRFYLAYGAEIYQVLNEAIKALNLNDCALHPEMKITKKGLKIVEIGPRLGGDFITSHLTPLSTGINMEEQLINIAVGEKINIVKKTNRYSSVLFFDLLKNNMKATQIANKITTLKDCVAAYELYFSDLNNLPVITNSLERHGHVIFSADSIEEIFSIKEKLLN